ncbi:MAG TPA: GAF domain-containing protein [Dehalococcoidia bacterium]|nr:GAF domain-containing protein [Dehalococcoidia bacterium]
MSISKQEPASTEALVRALPEGDGALDLLARLGEQQPQFTLAMEAGKMGLWQWDLTANRIQWTPGLEAIHGLAPGTFDGTFESYESNIHPEDLQYVRAKIQEALASGRMDLEYRILWPDRSTRWLASHGTLLKDAEGQATQLVGICQDITDRKLAEQDLTLSEARAKALFESALDAVIGLDRDGRISEFNPAAERIFGYRKEQAIGQIMEELLLPEAMREEFRIELQLLAGRRETAAARSEITARRADGTEFPAEISLASTQTLKGPIFNAYLRDISERRQVEQELKMRLRQQSSVAELGQMAAAGAKLPALLDRAVQLVARDLRVEFAKVLELQPGGEFLLVVAGVGWKEGVVGQTLVDVSPDTQAGYTLISNSPIIEDDLTQETRFRGHPLLWDHGIKSGMTVIIPGRGSPWGILSAHTAKSWRFTQYDLHFLNALAIIIGQAVEREKVEAERTMLLQHERAARSEAEQALLEREMALQQQRDVEDRLNSLVHVSSEMITSMEIGHVLDVVRDLSIGLVKADAFAVWRYDEATSAWHVISDYGLSEKYPRQTETSNMRMLAEPLALENVLTDESIIPSQRLPALEAEGVHSLLVMPLKIKGENTGTLTFYFRTSHHFSDVEIRLATALANLASSAITVSELYAEEASQRQRANIAGSRATFIAEATTVLSSSLDYDTTLDQLARLFVPFLSDWCYVSVLDSGDEPRPVSIVHRNPKKVALATKLVKTMSDDHIVSAGVRKSMETGSPVLFFDINSDLLEKAANNKQQTRMLKSLGLVSLMVLPLQARGRLLGTITLATAESGRRLDADDLSFAQQVASRAAIAVDNGRLYKEAQEARAELQLANEAKDEFLGMLSHELRSPITVIYGGARMLKSRADRMDTESRESVIADIEQESERLYRVVEDLLALARVELGWPIDTVPIQVAKWLEKVVNAFGQRRQSREIILDVEKDLPPATGEPVYLEQVLRNLLGNADKYSPLDKPITVKARHQGDEIIVSVMDRGPGIDESEIDLIFERFYRSERTSRQAKGAGIGLTVCKRLMEAQSGRIWAEQREGGGLIVSFALPAQTEDTI